ncbi:MAG: SpvB/TcaC N-terminal domain-containing protein, partial [Bacteroidales bacterium]
MKIISVPITMIILIIQFTGAYAQTTGKTLSLNGGSSTNIARDWVQMNEGLYSAGFLGKIDESQLYPVEYMASQPDPDRDLDYNLPVGSIPGSFDVSPTGAATYTIPIEVPPGTASMQPSLAITYNSQGGNGLLGKGWNLSGLSAITRVGKTIYHDGITRGVNLDANDRFALNGQRLMAPAAGYGNNGTNYTTEIHNFTKITSYGIAGDGPQYFTVVTKEGTTIWFGYTGDSRVQAQGSTNVIMWYVNKIQDIHGNYMEFEYDNDNDNGETVIKRIKYTKNSSQDHYNIIDFRYETRTKDKNILYVGGKYIQTSKLLRRISTSNNGNYVKIYDFKYTTGATEGTNFDPYSHLVEVLETGHDGIQLNSTIINWGFGTAACSQVTKFHSEFYADKYIFYYGDFTGDGKTDFVSVKVKSDYTSSDVFKLYRANEAGTNFEYVSQGNLKDDFEAFYTGDFDGDGKTDLLMQVHVDETQGEDWYYYPYYSAGTAFYNVTNDYFTVDFENEILISDFDGNGNHDCMLKRDTKVTGEDDWTIYSYNGGIRLLEYQYSGTIPSWGYNIYKDFGINLGNKYLLDFNGNGRKELLILDNNGYKIYEFGATANEIFGGNHITNIDGIYIGDFNGDGKTDIVHEDVSDFRKCYVNYATGNGFNTIFSENFTINFGIYSFSSDFNGDGRTDILTLTTQLNDTYFRIAYAGEFGDFEFVDISTDLSKILIHQIAALIGLVDMNGDGNCDMVIPYCRTSNSSNFYIYPHNTDMKNDLVTGITNGFNSQTTISYRPITDNTIYEKYTDAENPVMDLQVPLHVVSEFSQPTGTGSTSSIELSYKGAKVHKQGKGFLGFSEVISSDNATNIKTINTYSSQHTVGSNKYYMPLLTESATETTSGTAIADNNNYYGFHEYSNGTIYPFITFSTSYDYLHGTNTETNISYNIDGNLTLSSVNYCDITCIASVSTSYSNYADRIPSDLNTYPNKPGTITVSKTHIDDPNITHTRRTDYTYFNTGQVEHVISDPLLAKKCSTSYEYYANGTLKKTTLSATGLANRFTSYNYDAKGRFVTKVTDVLNNFTEKAYDEKTGNVIMEKDVMGNSIFYAYDASGRLKETWLPTGKRIEQSINWYTGTDLANAVYYTT